MELLNAFVIFYFHFLNYYLQGLELRAVSLTSRPFIEKLIPKKDGFYSFNGGIYADIFHVLKDILNFTYSLSRSPDGQWGALQANGTWTGMMRPMQNDVFDIGIHLFILFHKTQFWAILFEIWR